MHIPFGSYKPMKPMKSEFKVNFELLKYSSFLNYSTQLRIIIICCVRARLQANYWSCNVTSLHINHIHSVLPKNGSRLGGRAWFGRGLRSHQSFWSLSFPTSNKNCSEGLQGRHALSMLGRTLIQAMAERLHDHSFHL